MAFRSYAFLRCLLSLACLHVANGFGSQVDKDDVLITKASIPHHQAGGTITILDTLFYSPTHVETPKPLIIGVQGAAVLAAEYSELNKRLARKGYVVAIPNNSARPMLVDPSCPVQPPPFPSARVINSVYDYVTKEQPSFVALTDLDQLLLFGHSAGGAAALAAAGGACKGVKGKGNPMCEGYEEILDANGDDSVKGVLLYEGYDFTNRDYGDKFITYVASTFDTASYGAFNDKTIARAKNFFQIDKATHYSVNNYQSDDNPPLCGAERSGDEGAFTQTEENAEQGLDLIAEAFSASVDAFLRGDLPAQDWLNTGAVAEFDRVTMTEVDVAGHDGP